MTGTINCELLQCACIQFDFGFHEDFIETNVKELLKKEFDVYITFQYKTGYQKAVQFLNVDHEVEGVVKYLSFEKVV